MERISLFTKCIAIGGIVLLAWLMSLIVDGLVLDRSSRANEVQQEVASSWPEGQKVVGPLLRIPYKTGTDKKQWDFIYLTPELLNIDAQLASNTLHRGIFDVPVYTLGIKGEGTFNLDMSDLEKAYGNQDSTKLKIDWGRVQVVMPLSDKRGIEQTVMMELDKMHIALDKPLDEVIKTGEYDLDNPAQCIASNVNLASLYEKGKLSFRFEASLKGSSHLSIAPIGDNSTIKISGNSKDPSFNGFVLPSVRTVNKEGFSAEWQVSALNRSDVGHLFKDLPSGGLNMVGVSLLVEGGQYTQTDRATKYAFLVILLLLGAVFMAELSVGGKVSLMNYLLIGIALPLFYLLLLSFGEWVGFTLAYVFASVMIVGMVVLYLHAILRTKSITLAVGLFMSVVYGFVYVLLSVSDVALLLGALALFVVLGGAMFLSLRLKYEDEDDETDAQ